MPPHFTITEARRARFRVRSLMMLVAAAGLVAWVLREPVLRFLLIAIVMWVGATALVLLVAMALGGLGFAVVAAVERLAGVDRGKPKAPRNPLDL
jgi:hypothetical protein